MHVLRSIQQDAEMFALEMAGTLKSVPLGDIRTGRNYTTGKKEKGKKLYFFELV